MQTETLKYSLCLRTVYTYFLENLAESYFQKEFEQGKYCHYVQTGFIRYTFKYWGNNLRMPNMMTMLLKMMIICHMLNIQEAQLPQFIAFA